MRRTRYQLQLHNPCPESWDGMTPTDTGRFCQLCAKNVIDFTGLTDDQVLAILKKNGSNFCGRIKQTQLNRDLITRTETTLSARIFKVLAGLFLFATTDGTAQEFIEPQPKPLTKPPTEQEAFEHQKRYDPDYALGTRVKGQVLAKETQQPVPNASIRVDGLNYTARSDSAGYFQLLLPDSLAQRANRFVFAEPYQGRTSLTAHVSDFPATIELSYAPKLVISGGGLVVVKRKWWQWRKKKECSE